MQAVEDLSTDNGKFSVDISHVTGDWKNCSSRTKIILGPGLCYPVIEITIEEHTIYLHSCIYIYCTLNQCGIFDRVIQLNGSTHTFCTFVHMAHVDYVSL